MAINGAHVLLYSSESDALRAMLRDAFGFTHVDAGEGWLIFALPPAELGVHPAEGPTFASGVRHQFTFMCDDINSTVRDLKAKGVRVEGEPRDEGWGITVMLVLPGDVHVMLYEPRHEVAISSLPGALSGKEERLSAGKALMHRWFEEVWNNGRADLIDELTAPNCVIHGLGPATMGPAEFKSFYQAYRGAFPDVKVQIDQTIGEGPLVAVCWTGTGTHRGDTLGFPATGKAVRFTGMTTVRIAENRLVEAWNSFDQLGMLQQLGVANTPRS